MKWRLCVFNFFDELKKKSTNSELLSNFNVVNMSGRLMYVEGHQGLTVLSTQMIAFKVKKGRFVVEGEELKLSELTENTMIIQGKIVKAELF